MPHRYSGGCHCGNIEFEMVLSAPSASYSPRACDCAFCRAHAASYVSDPQGKLEIRVKDATNLSKYRQGSGIAECLICKICGVLVGVSYNEGGHLYATANSKAVKNSAFGAETVVSPKTLSDPDKIGRWKDVWFSVVAITCT